MTCSRPARTTASISRRSTRRPISRHPPACRACRRSRAAASRPAPRAVGTSGPGTPIPIRRRSTSRFSPIWRTASARCGWRSVRPGCRSTPWPPRWRVCCWTWRRSRWTRARATRKPPRPCWRCTPSGACRTSRSAAAWASIRSAWPRGPATRPTLPRPRPWSPSTRAGIRRCAAWWSTHCPTTRRAAPMPRNSAAPSRPVWPTCVRSPTPGSTWTPPPPSWSSVTPLAPTSSSASPSCGRRGGCGRG